ncbi:acyltransferase family protein [Pseudarthrobacter sp. IC2-21]|uniref:acyltransferase family protein n=1 Tax=Pseudarthrobacter sp. IC2-21 TaxID=3092262 RepID=UPI002A6B6EFA|nr:acyltransferase family protein [Pseudarthrobacter sp. IC2-21]
MPTSLLARNSQRPSLAPSKSNFRADIQGLRALAVLAVIFDHLFHWPSGGFVGVDIFFVISGFLITGHLLREHDKTGKISFLSFYRRRTLRIVPAAVVVLIFTAAVSFIAFNAARASTVLQDSIWALLFSANWRFAIAGTDYFQAASAVSPLQHFWSLAVEEQFYFVWPWLMVLIFAVLAKAGMKQSNRLAVGIAMAAIVGASFAWSLAESASNPSVAYFSTFSRAWELGVGALLAVFAALLVRMPFALRSVLAWVGLVGLAFSLFFITSGMAFPGPWAALPVLSTAMVIAAGTGRHAPRNVLLANPVSRYLGDISYSLYLWHFPVIVLAGVFLREDSAAFFLAVLAITAVFSVGSYHLVEQPLQQAPLFRRFKHQSERQRAFGSWMHQYGERYKYGALAMLVVVTMAVTGLALGRNAPATTPVAVPSVAPAEQKAAASEAETVFGPTGKQLTTEIQTALGAQSWPELSPALDDVIGKSQTPAQVGLCQGSTPPSESECTYGSPTASKTIVLVGDSTSAAYTKAFQDIISSRPDWKVIQKSMGGCRFVDLTFANDVAAISEACPARIASAVETINRVKPELVVITNGYKGTVKDTGKPVTSAEWGGGLSRLTAKFSAAARKIVFLVPPPSGPSIEECYDRFSKPSDCLTTVDGGWSQFLASEQSVARSINAAVIDTRPLYCVSNSCPAFVGTTPVKVDHVHLTQAYVQKITPAIESALVKAGGLGS